MHTKDIKLGLVGCGHRGVSGFLRTIKDLGYADHVVALFDTNPERLNFAGEFLGAKTCRRHGDFASFLQTPGLTSVVVATPDDTHCEFVVPCFQSGKEVVCEKPMATNLDDCRAMLASQDGHRFQVAFNLRFNRVSQTVKELLESGRIGDVCSIEARDMIGWQHGADYFRRWHRRTERSGGLFVHKSVHSFDVMNWWLDECPESVFATSAQRFFRPENATPEAGDNCAECPLHNECPFFIDLTADVPGQYAGIADFYRRMYVDGKKHDGYVRDACVFHPDNDISDLYQANIRYTNGAMVSYSAVFFAPYESKLYAIQGERGRLEVDVKARTIVVYTPWDEETEQTIRVPEEAGSHGGADQNLVEALFHPEDPAYALPAAEAGYWSLAVAVAANESAACGNAVAIPALRTPA